jgi:serine/threonine protein kinase/tetratricopeptide (TPR) repeat protein
LTPPESPEISKSCVTCSGSFSGDVSVCPNDGTPLTSVVEDRQPGSIIAEKYEIIEVIGTGGMGKVYKAKHTLMNRIVAIKTLLPQSVSNAVALKRFQQEAQAASALNHPNILTVYDFGITPDGLPYLVMDFLEGTTLGDAVLDVGPLPVRRSLPIFLQVCDGLAHAHENGVIHRDLKPTNIMLIEYNGNPDFVKIVDFGIAKVVPKDDTENSNSEQLTQTGEIFGSPLYMSPEQCQGKSLDARSDIYSFGCVMFRTLCGKPPFTGENRLDAMFKQIKEAAPRLCDISPDVSVSNDLESIVLRCLAKEPDERFASMNDLAVALEGLSESHMIPSRSGARASQLRITAQTAPLGQDAEKKIESTVVTKSGKQEAAKQESSKQATIAPKSTEETDPNLPSITITTPPAVMAAATAASGLAKSVANKFVTQPRIALASSVVALLVVVGGGFLFFGSNKNSTTQSGPAAFFSKKPGDMVKEAEKLISKGKYQAAEQMAGDALKAAKEQQDLPGTIAASAALAHICLREYKYNDAWTYANWVLEVKKHGDEVDDFQYSRVLNILGAIATIEKNFPKAHEYLNEAQKIREGFQGSYRTYYARTLAAQGNLAVREGHYASAITLLEKAKDIAVQTSGMDDLETQGIFNDLGQAYQFAGKLGNAEECYTTALEERKRLLDPENPAIAESEICLAFLRARQGRTEEAVKLFERALSIDEKAFGKNSPTVAQLCFSLAEVLEAQKKYVLAEAYYREALLMREATLKPNDPVLLDTQKKYQAVLKKLKKR